MERISSPGETRFNFNGYSVTLTNNRIIYEKEFANGRTRTYPVPCHFEITVDEEREGGKIEIKYKDRWGSSMHFIHYAASDLKGLFDFIARGYNVKLEK